MPRQGIVAGVIFVRLAMAALVGGSALTFGCATGVTIDPTGGSSGEGGEEQGNGGAGASSADGGEAASGGSMGQGGAAGPGGASGEGGSTTVAVCGNGVVEPGEACDDDNDVQTDACLTSCEDASCGDGFVQSAVEECDDGNVLPGDDCSATCTSEATTFGPTHTFENLTSSFYVTQFGCSNSGGDAALDALYFCQHFYSSACTPDSFLVATSSSPIQMHSGTNCNDPDPAGVSVQGTSCIGGPCKIGNYPTGLGGLADIVCSCP